jgi:putative oxidoreductase
MGALSIAISFGVRLALVLLFLPFSALDKILDFRGAIAQAEQDVASHRTAAALVGAGLFVEVVMSAGVLTGIADRAAALILAFYCAVTALLWKQFWRPGDFWAGSKSRGRTLFWDFWKNIALSGGFLLVTFGTSAATVGQFFADPISSTHPYAVSPNMGMENTNLNFSQQRVRTAFGGFNLQGARPVTVRFDPLPWGMVH